MSAPALPGRRWPALFWVGVLSIALGCDDPPRADAEDPVADAAAASSDDAALNGETDIERDAGADALADAEDAAQPSPSSADAAVAPPPPAVRLNEIECRGDEWIELYFGGPGPVSLTGWTVSDDNDDPERTLTLDGVTIQPGTVWQSPDELPFKIGCSGDQIRLRAPDGVLVDTVSLDGPDTGLTWGRLPDGDGEWTLTEPTPGQLNAPPAPPTVRFNEIDCSGRARIELVSPEGEDVALAGWSIGVRANDDGGPGERYRLGGRLGAEEYQVVRQRTQTDDGFTFAVTCAGQELTLYRPDGEIADRVGFENVPAAYTWGRLPDGQGDWQWTAPTMGAPNAPAPPEAVAPFDPTEVLEIDLTLDEGSREALLAEPREYARGWLTVRGYTMAPLAVGLRIKGRIGSFRRLNEKPGWKIKMDFVEPDQRFLGLERMTLNNMVQDPSQIHEWSAYGLFRSLGLPAPRVGYAFVRLDGEVYGVYTIIESPDDDLLGRWFATTQHLYEGGYGQDLFPQHIDQLEADRGDLIERGDLQAVVDRLEGLPAAEFYENSADIIHWERVIYTMATEIWTGHWDGYAPSRNNYYFHFDDDGRLSVLPWGTDQTFNRHIALHGGRGRLMEACMAAPMCRARFDRALAAVDRQVRDMSLVDGIRAQAERLQPWQAMDDRSGRSAQQIANQVARTIAFIERQHEITADALGCLLGPDPDPDGDGALCEADCNNDDPTIHPDAPEICGDGIDQDCSGTADDGPDCPDCVPVGQAAHRYWVCPNRRTFDDAVAHCAEEDAELVHIQSPAENDWVRRVAADIRPQDYWLGLTDRAEQGDFRWPDGSDSEGFSRWRGGEPNGGDREDCVSLRPQEGAWYDRRCSDEVAVICEAPCPVEIDADEDGVSMCAGDCDDGDPNRAPGRPEVCDDALDNDCDGAVDEGRECTCRGRIRGDRRYFFCSDGAPWEAARAACRDRGGDLAVIETPAENDYLRREASEVARANWWIGLSDRAEEGTFAWIDGQALEYRNWSGNEPNDWQGSEDCGELISGTGLWNDFRCDRRRPFICEGDVLVDAP